MVVEQKFKAAKQIFHFIFNEKLLKNWRSIFLCSIFSSNFLRIFKLFPFFIQEFPSFLRLQIPCFFIDRSRVSLTLHVNIERFAEEADSRMTDTKSPRFSRLPETAKPLVYDIYLKPDLVTFRYTGHVAIVVEVSFLSTVNIDKKLKVLKNPLISIFFRLTHFAIKFGIRSDFSWPGPVPSKPAHTFRVRKLLANVFVPSPPLITSPH